MQIVQTGVSGAWLPCTERVGTSNLEFSYLREDI